MKALRIVAVAGSFVALLYAAWADGYRKGSRETADRESKAWEALIASGRLDGLESAMLRRGAKFSAEDVGYISADYRSDYEHFMAAAAKVTEQSSAHWLMGNHTRGKMKPEDFQVILQDNQGLSRSSGKVDATETPAVE